MINLSDLITGIRLKIAGDTYLNGLFGNQVTYGIVPQQNSSGQTIYPYCGIYSVGPGEANGSFGDNFLDVIVLQFTVWSISMSTTSSAVKALGELLNHASLTLADNNLVGMRRSSTVRQNVPGQEQNQKFVYQGSVDFTITISGC